MTVFIQLTIAGTDVGPFDLYSNATSPTFSDPPFETGISRASLVAGFTSYLVPDDTTIIRIQSTGVCTNYIDVSVVATTTTTSTTEGSTTSTTSTSTSTSTTTTTTTAIPLDLTYDVYETDCEDDCPRTNGQITINGTIAFSWTGFTPLPLSGTLSPFAGDEIIVTVACYAGGTCSIGMQATVSISVGGVECDTATDGTATCTFTITENTSIEILPGCLIPN